MYHISWVAFLSASLVFGNTADTTLLDELISSPIESCDPRIVFQASQVNELKPAVTANPDTVAGQAQQCRAVLGEFPKEFDCSKGTEIPIINKKTGRQVILDADGKYYELDGQDKVPSNWSKSKDQIPCEHPVVAPGFAREACAIGSRIVRQQVGPTIWVGFCRTKKDQSSDNPTFSSMSVYGYNEKTGETCFFDYNPPDHPRKEEAFLPLIQNVLPPGSVPVSPTDEKKLEYWKAQADFKQGNTCIECHGNNGPLLRTPYAESAGVQLPQEPTTSGVGYRVLGSLPRDLIKPSRTLSAAEEADLRRWRKAITPMSVQPRIKVNGIYKKDTTCTECHTISSNFLEQADGFLIHSAVGLPGALNRPGKAWMPPGINNNDPEELANARAAAERLLHCMRHPEDNVNCYPSEPLYTDCPEPAPLKEETLQLTTRENIDLNDFPQELNLQWNYVDPYNQKSGVSNRDDIRMEITLTGSDGSLCSFKDVPIGKNGIGTFRLPARGGVTYTATVTPKRNCYDLSGGQTAANSSSVRRRTPGYTLENTPTQRRYRNSQGLEH